MHHRRDMSFQLGVLPQIQDGVEITGGFPSVQAIQHNNALDQDKTCQFIRNLFYEHAVNVSILFVCLFAFIYSAK